MLRQITEDVFLHQSEFLESNSVIVKSEEGVLLIDPGITSEETASLAQDIKDMGLPVIAGYSTHPHWDHLLWHSEFGTAPRYGTARNETAIQEFLSNQNWRTAVAPMLPADIAHQIPMDNLFGKITGLPVGTVYIPWNGPKVRIIEHNAHALGSAALFVEEHGVLVAGDMLSDILVPFLEMDALNPVDDYLATLKVLNKMVDKVEFFVPGHGSVGDAKKMGDLIEHDSLYVRALQAGGGGEDFRLTTGPHKDLLSSVHAWQSKKISQNTS